MTSGAQEEGPAEYETEADHPGGGVSGDNEGGSQDKGGSGPLGLPGAPELGLLQEDLRTGGCWCVECVCALIVYT